MAMSKKDYEVIAEVIKEAREARSLSRLETVLMLQRKLTDYFKADNPNFDVRQFELACMSHGSENTAQIEEVEPSAYNMVADGRLYEVIHQSETQKFARRSVMSFLSEDKDNIVFNARPLAGTQEMPRKWIIAVRQAEPGAKRCLNERAV